MYLKILLLTILFIYLYINNLNKNKLVIEKFNNNNKYNLFQTYHKKELIPNKVYSNIRKYAKNYNHIIFDDKDCINFIKKNYNSKVLQAWHNLKYPAHKADLWRYCILYKYGGLYLDIKIELVKDIDTIILDKTITYTVISSEGFSIFNAVIFSPPKNPMFLNLINHIIYFSKLKPTYLLFINYFYNFIKKNSILFKNKKLENQKIIMKKYPDIYLFQERCNKNPTNCYDKLDRYGFCCWIYNKSTKIIKSRYADYPWKKQITYLPHNQ